LEGVIVAEPTTLSLPGAPSGHPLPLALEGAVPVWIAEIKDRGGPDDTDYERVRAFAPVLAERGDRLLHGSRVPGETADLFNRLADALAVLAFLPGGVRAFGRHWEAGK
jgi:hypothetical protein